MSTRAKIRASIAAAAIVFGGPALAADEPAVMKDLTAVIALQGQPCGQVVTATKNGDNDYAVACKDGSRYRVFVNADGRVVVQKQ
ncbi:MAG: hypothetical protein ACRELZ_03245 [Candidatus Rokuibacteriota bacterium]